MKFRILSIDGGGIKGLFPAAFLASIEERIGGRTADYFDLIAGTSTGGIVALGLGLGLSAAKLRDFYVDLGPAIFNDSWLKGARHWGTSKYSPDPLKRALERALGTRKLGDSKTRLLIPSLNLDTGEVYVYKTAHHLRFSFDFRVPAVDVALATAAAPTYFPAHQLGNGIPLVDGGVWANNPTGSAVIEAIGVLGQPSTEIEVLSLGCTEPLLDVKPGFFSGKLFWAKRVTDLFMAGQSSGSIGSAKILLGGGDRLHRVSPVVAPKRFSLDGTEAMRTLRALGEDAARREFPKLGDRFFKEPAQPFTPLYSEPIVKASNL